MFKKAALAAMMVAGLVAGLPQPAQARHWHHYGRGWVGPAIAGGIAASAYSSPYYGPYGYSPYYDGGYYGSYGYGYGYGYPYYYHRRHSALPYIVGGAALGYALSR